MENIEPIFNKKFLNFFTKKEINEIVDASIAISDNTIIVDTEYYFFELSVGPESLEIFCYTESEEKYIDKYEFMKLYKNSSYHEMQHICIAE